MWGNRRKNNDQDGWSQAVDRMVAHYEEELAELERQHERDQRAKRPDHGWYASRRADLLGELRYWRRGQALNREGARRQRRWF